MYTCYHSVFYNVVVLGLGVCHLISAIETRAITVLRARMASIKPPTVHHPHQASLSSLRVTFAVHDRNSSLERYTVDLPPSLTMDTDMDDASAYIDSNLKSVVDDGNVVETMVKGNSSTLDNVTWRVDGVESHKVSFTDNSATHTELKDFV